MKPNKSNQKKEDAPVLYIIPAVQYEAFAHKLEIIHEWVLNSKSPKNIIAEGWLTENEAKETLGKGTTSLWALRKSNAIKSSKIGGKTYYCVDSIKQYLEKGASK